MLKTPFPFFISKKPGEITIFGTFLAKKMDFFFQFWVYFHWKSTFWVRPCLKTSLWRHTLTDFHDFGINGKRRPYPIPWYQKIILWARQFQVHKGVVTTPLGKPCYKKWLGRTRVKRNPLRSGSINESSKGSLYTIQFHFFSNHFIKNQYIHWYCIILYHMWNYFQSTHIFILPGFSIMILLQLFNLMILTITIYICM